MVNYSIVMRNNPMDADAAKKAYASAQYAEVMDINRFAMLSRLQKEKIGRASCRERV